MNEFIFRYAIPGNFGSQSRHIPKLPINVPYPPKDTEAFATWFGFMQQQQNASYTIEFSMTNHEDSFVPRIYLMLGTTKIAEGSNSGTYMHCIFSDIKNKNWIYFMFRQGTFLSGDHNRNAFIEIDSPDARDNLDLTPFLCRIFSQGKISGEKLDQLSQIGIIPSQSVPVDEVGPTTAELSNHQSTKRFDPTDGKLVETIPNSADYEGDEFPDMVINGGDDNDRYFKCKLPKFRTIHEVLEFADTVRDALIEDFNEKARREYLGPTLALRSKAPKPYWFEEVNNNTDNSDGNSDIVRFEFDMSEFDSEFDISMEVDNIDTILTRAWRARNAKKASTGILGNYSTK